MSEPTKDELRKEIAAILKDANLEETAAKKVRLQLEANLKCDLSARKKEVDDLVMEYVNAQDESGEDEEEDEEEEEEAPKKKGSKKKQESEDEEEDEEDSEDDKKKKGKRGAPAKRGSAKKQKRGGDSEDESEGSDGGSDDDYKPNKGPKAAAKKGGRKKKGGSDSDGSDEGWKPSKPAKAKKAAGGAKKGKGTGFTRPYNLSPELAAICGAEALPRHEVVKKVWTIIKERNLYDPKNKQYAICDSELQKVIGVKRFRTFGMLKYLKPHFLD